MCKRLYVMVLCLCCVYQLGVAQMQVSGIPMTIAGGPASYNAMIQQLFGAGVSVSNITLNCNTGQLQAGWFTANGTNLGLSQGMLLTSGDINGGPGPNTAANYTGAVQNGLGDADLNGQIVGFTTNDACIIEFDVVPYCDTLSIKYVFGSDEYEEFVNSIYNDVFAFFITGLNPAGGNYVTQNIALIPNTVIPVSINNVNCTSNSAYYRCNSTNSTAFGCAAANCPSSNAATSLQYDGLTTVLTAKAAVVPCQSYHIKIAVADGGGHLLDSGVFLQAGGVNCNTTPLNVNNITTAVEGCAAGVFNFTFPTPLQNPDTFIFQVAGTATAGVDYPINAIPDTLIVPAGATSATISVPVLSDLINDAGETIQLIYSDTALCGTQVVLDTFTMYILEPPTTTAGPNKVVCSGVATNIGVTASLGHSYHWSPNTGMTTGGDTLANPTLTLNNTSNLPYTLTYTLIDSAGNTGCVSVNTVNVTVNPKPVASFTAPNVCNGTLATFTNTSTPNVQGSQWNFGDLGTSIQTNATHLYNLANTYQVQLITTSTAGCLDTVIQPLTIYPKPVANFTANNACLHTPTLFTDNSSAATQWTWLLGNGNTSFNNQNATYTYPNAGTYQVQLLIQDAQGCKDTVAKPVQVYALPVANFTVQNKCVYQSLTFQNQSVAGSNPINTNTWNFGDMQISAQTSPSHLYNSAGNYAVNLIVADAFGCADTISKSVEVYPKPAASFSMLNGCQAAAVAFTNNSSITTGTITANHWYFGDNATANLISPTHTYNNAGVYPVELQITSNFGCKDSVILPLTIFPKANTKFSATNVCLGETTTFTDNSTITTSTDSIVVWNWNLGDGNASSAQNTTHTYASAGSYGVTLTTITDKGCVDSLRRIISVNPIPDLPIVHNDTVCFGKSAYLFASSSEAVSIRWFSNPNDATPFHTGVQYSINAVTQNTAFYVQAVAAVTGCKSSLTPIQALIYPPSNQTLQIADTMLFIPNATTSFSVNSNVPIAQYSWTFGDDEVSYLANPTHQYTYPREFLVEVVTVDSNGCRKTLKGIATVKEISGVHVPSAFSPNGDNINDEFWVGNYEIAQFNIGIYDRWGKVIFSSENPDFRWNGKSKDGRDCPEGVYTYVLHAITTNQKKIEKVGTITLIR